MTYRHRFQLKDHFTLLLILLVGITGVDSAWGQAQGDAWFYVVKSRPTDPAREAEFNAWYDDIDIPDVLAVPSFQRARRAKGVAFDETPELDLDPREGKYIALYDIQSSDIDKSIIDLYVAARRMNALGRSTDLLKVVEANYHERTLSWPVDSRDSADDKERYLFLQKFLCCKDPGAKDEFLEWYKEKYVPSLSAIEGTTQISLYQLYRVMEDWALEPEEIPHVLVIHEIAGKSAADVARAIATQAIRPKPSFVGDASFYVQMSEVLSP